MDSKFLSEPRPERFSQISSFGVGGTDGKGTNCKTLTIGVQLVTHTPDGLKIVPTKAVSFAIGPREGDAEQHIVDLPPAFARALAGRLVEFADAAEAK